jgi:hypothetical protein
MSRGMTSRSLRHRAWLQHQLLEAQGMRGHQRVRALRCVARHSLHLGVREVAQQARELARAGGAA